VTFGIESFQRKALVIRQREAHKAEQVTCYGLHAVLTPPKFRRKGYARHMLRLMHWVFASSSPQLSLLSFPDSWGARPAVEGYGDAQFSVLYTDIGEQYYLRCGPGEQEGDGWLVRDPISTLWDVDPHYISNLNHSRERWEWLDEAGVEEIWKTDARTMEKEFAHLAASSPSDVLFTFLPDNGLATYQIHLASLYPTTHMQNFTRWGIILPDTGEGTDKPTFATWTIDVPDPTLIVTRLRTSPATFPFILSKIMEVARDSQLIKVEVWNLPKVLIHIGGGETIKRDHYLPSFKWYGEEKPGDIEWAFNEKSVFCCSNFLYSVYNSYSFCFC
jgi:hypothetical protein